MKKKKRIEMKKNGIDIMNGMHKLQYYIKKNKCLIPSET